MTWLLRLEGRPKLTLRYELFDILPNPVSFSRHFWLVILFAFSITNVLIGKKETNLIISCNLGLIQGVMVFNATFNNIKDIK
jgi:hypothetical protein